MSEPELSDVVVRLLEASELAVLNRDLRPWSSVEYARRLEAQRRGDLAQAIAWDGEVPLGRGMALWPGHEEYSISSHREGCAEVRDVFVPPEHRRRGIASAIMRALESAAVAAGMRRIGLAVGVQAEAAPARALYERLGYRHAHGPFVSSRDLIGDEGPIPVGAVLIYLVKEL